MKKIQNKIAVKFSSGKGNTLDVILADEEIKGTGSRFVNVLFAQRVAESLNIIFKNKFKITYNVFCVEELVIDKPISLNPVLSKMNPFNWSKESFEDAITDGDYYLSLNKKFDWSQHDITKAIYEFHTEKSASRTKVINTKSALTISRGGGYTFSSVTICLYDFYYIKKEKPFFKDEGGSSEFTLGGTYLHEIMYHIYPGDFGQGNRKPNYMRRYFNLALNKGVSVDHGKGSHLRDKEFWRKIRNKNLKTIWKK